MFDGHALDSNEIQRFLKNLSTSPGVYCFLDANKTVLYVGKAANLKKRVASYFNSNLKTPKTQSLIQQIKAIEITVTRSETEALLLESNFIKSLCPKYNVLMRDDKTYPYLFLSTHAFPRLQRIRVKKKSSQGMFYGPYPNSSAVAEALVFIQKTFKIRSCRDVDFHSRQRPCIQYQLKRCLAPCVSYVSEADYAVAVHQAKDFLNGRAEDLLDAMAAEMDAAVLLLNFERAAVLRDQIRNLRLIQEQQGISKDQGDADIIVIEAKAGFSAVQRVSVREGAVLSNQSFFPKVPHESFDDEAQGLEIWQQVFHAFIGAYYLDVPARIPPMIITHHPIRDQKLLEALLKRARGKSFKFKTHVDLNERRWLDFAMNNLDRSISAHQSSDEFMRTRFEALRLLLLCPRPINRIECFDISHTQGNDTVASCVVFDALGPKKQDYRQFNITGIHPGDDYAAMEQVIIRRFKRLQASQDLPDLLVIDGGKGQISSAYKALLQLGLGEQMIIGLAKGPGRKADFDRLILPSGHEQLILAADSTVLHLLQFIRNEAHRFAISAHRRKRRKTSLGSILDTIPGVGPKRRAALLNRFGGQQDLIKASLEEIAKVSGIGWDLARCIHEHLHLN